MAGVNSEPDLVTIKVIPTWPGNDFAGGVNPLADIAQQLQRGDSALARQWILANCEGLSLVSTPSD